MPKYQVVENRVATVIIYIDVYFMILELIKKELQCPDLENNERIRLRLAHLEFQQLFYTGRSNRPSTVWRDLQIREEWEDTTE